MSTLSTADMLATINKVQTDISGTKDDINSLKRDMLLLKDSNVEDITKKVDEKLGYLNAQNYTEIGSY